MAVEDEFCALNELADRMSAAVVERYAMPHGTVLTCRFSDGDVLSMDASENIRIVARQNAVLEIFRQIEQGEILVLNASFMPAARPIKYSDFDRRIIPRAQADNIVRSIAGVPEPKSEVATKTELSDPQRRLARLRELGGKALFKHGEWKFSGIAALVKAEAREGRKRHSEKTVRDDLRAAAELERQEQRDSILFSGLGDR